MHYRVVRRTVHGEVLHGIHEVYYGVTGKPVAVTADARIIDSHEGLAGLTRTLLKMLEALDEPVLDYEDGFPSAVEVAETGTKLCVDCRYSELADKLAQHLKCLHSSATLDGKISPVDGKKAASRQDYCSENRAPWTYRETCGPQAKFFEPKSEGFV